MGGRPVRSLTARLTQTGVRLGVDRTFLTGKLTTEGYHLCVDIGASEREIALAQGAGPGVAELSDRQYECLSRAGQGMSSKEIARLLGISPSTVDNHIHVAVTKLNAKNRWQAAQLLHRVPYQNDFDHRNSSVLIPPLGGSKNTSAAHSRLI